MTQLALAVDADDELWTLDSLPTPAAPYVEVGSELVEVRSRFPSSYYTLTGETLPPRIRVRRGIAGTTAATHDIAATLTPTYGLGGGGGGGAIAVDNTVDEPVEVSTLVVGATFGPEGTATLDAIIDIDSVTGAFAKVQVQATEDNGQAIITAQAVDAVDAGATINATATSDGGAALVNNKAAAAGVGGTATARLDAEGQTAEAGLSAGDGVTVIGVEATWDGTGLGVGVLTIRAGDVGLAGDPGDVLTADATFGSIWSAPVDPLTSAGAIVVSAAAAANVLTLGADGSFEVNGSGVVRLLGLPSADPEVAGQLYTNGAPSGGVPQALMVSGGPA